MTNRVKIETLRETGVLSPPDWTELLSSWTEDDREYAAGLAREIAQARFGKQVFIRGIVEFSNYCRNDCYYCGLRCSNRALVRYRLDESCILNCCRDGYENGFRTFVLQSGEDSLYGPARMAALVRLIKREFPDCAVTLSVGELEKEDYRLLREAGADRYLLRHETADETHYGLLHPARQSWKHRMDCLRNLKELGFQTGCGMMVGSPFQTPELLAKDMLFIRAFEPQMIGIGPFLPHKDTPFAAQNPGSFELTLFLLSLCRIMLPDVLLPATTALGTIRPGGREQGILAGANVIMPNLSPQRVRKNYMLYDNKLSSPDPTSVILGRLRDSLSGIGYKITVGRGDYHKETRL